MWYWDRAELSKIKQHLHLPESPLYPDLNMRRDVTGRGPPPPLETGRRVVRWQPRHSLVPLSYHVMLSYPCHIVMSSPCHDVILLLFAVCWLLDKCCGVNLLLVDNREIVMMLLHFAVTFCHVTMSFYVDKYCRLLGPFYMIYKSRMHHHSYHLVLVLFIFLSERPSIALSARRTLAPLPLDCRHS